MEHHRLTGSQGRGNVIRKALHGQPTSQTAAIGLISLIIFIERSYYVTHIHAIRTHVIFPLQRSNLRFIRTSVH